MNERNCVNGAHIPTGAAASVIKKKKKLESCNYLRGMDMLFSGENVSYRQSSTSGRVT